MTRSALRTLPAALGALVLLAGCATVDIPKDAWTITPIAYDNALDGESPEEPIDVTYPMGNITPDTAGGIWTESAESWLHLDEAGTTLQRFNTELFVTVHGISAVSPTVLAVSRTDRENLAGGSGLFLFDTKAKSWERVDAAGSTTGDVEVATSGRLLFVDFLGMPAPDAFASAQTEFAVRAIDSAGRVSTVLESEEGRTARVVAIDSDASGAVYVRTNSETLIVDANGEVTTQSEQYSGWPVLAVSPGGNLLTADPTSTPTRSPASTATSSTCPSASTAAGASAPTNARCTPPRTGSRRSCSTAE